MPPWFPFSSLFIGSGGATRSALPPLPLPPLSVPFSSGLVVQLINVTPHEIRLALSVPFSSGLVVQLYETLTEEIAKLTFSSLFIGSGGATPPGKDVTPCFQETFSSLFIGSGGATTRSNRATTSALVIFQFPFHRVWWCNRRLGLGGDPGATPVLGRRGMGVARCLLRRRPTGPQPPFICEISG